MNSDAKPAVETENFGTPTPNVHPLADLSSNPSAEGLDSNPFSYLSQDFVRIERLKIWIFTAVLGLVALVTWVTLGLLMDSLLQFASGIWLVIILFGLVAGVSAGSFFPKRHFESTTWRLGSHGLEIRHGIWWKHRIFVPRNHIQHTDVQQGPLMRAYGLACLVINTGGTHEPSIPLEGLGLEIAEQIRNELNGRNIVLSNTPSETKSSHAKPS